LILSIKNIFCFLLIWICDKNLLLSVGVIIVRSVIVLILVILIVLHIILVVWIIRIMASFKVWSLASSAYVLLPDFCLIRPVIGSILILVIIFIFVLFRVVIALIYIGFINFFVRKFIL